ncbi:MAG: MliC family protein [Pseudomonadota bacterium]
MNASTFGCALASAALLSAASPAHAIDARYVCDKGARIYVQFSPPGLALGRATLAFASGEKVVLPQVMSADGGRYANSEIEFWVKGKGARLTRNGKVQTCRTR